MKLLATALALVLIGLVLVTALALESGDVAIAVTTSESGPRSTHIWFVNASGRVFLEAGNPENPWVKDLMNGSSLRLTADGLDGQYSYELFTNGRHEEIRGMMRQKYGWRDWWVAMLFDTDASFLIEARSISGK